MAPVTLLSSTASLHRSLSSHSTTRRRRLQSSKSSFYPQISPILFLSKPHLGILHHGPPNYMTKTSSLLLDKQNSDFDVNRGIIRLLELGKLKEIMQIITSSGFKTAEICSDTYFSILKLCAEYRSLEDGRKTHLIISSSGIRIDNMLGSKLVFMYIQCGELLEARKVFDKIAPKANIFTWNILIKEYVKANEFKESLLLFKQMHKLGICPDSFTFSSIFKCFASLGSLHEGEISHAYVIKLGLGSYIAVGNALLSFYCKLGRIGIALNLFDEMPSKDIISWNTLISGCVSNELPTKAIDLFVELYAEGIEIDLASLVSVLPACSELGLLSIGKIIHGYSIKSRLSSEITLSNCLIDMYSKCSCTDSSIQIYKRMTQKSIVTYTSMISAFTRAELFDQAIDLFVEIKSKGIKPDTRTVACVLRACGGKGSMEKCLFIHNYAVRYGMNNNIFVSNALMDMHAKCDNMDEARSLFESNSKKDIISWNILIGGYAKNGLPNDALKLFGKMTRRMKPNAVTMSSVLPAISNLSCLERGKEIHGYILRTGSMDCHVSNALIDMYVKCGALLPARVLFDQIYEKDLVTWTVMIAGYCMHGHGKEAISLFKKMRKKNIKPDEISFVALLHACSHSGLLHEGWFFFDTMRNEYKMCPTLEHYACMVGLLSSVGYVKKAYSFIESMPIEPDSTVWTALLSGCRGYRDMNLAKRIAEKVFDSDPNNTEFYKLLTKLYAEADKWEKVKKIRERIGKKGLSRKPSCSWIVVRGKVNVFVSGERSYPQSKEIEEFIEYVTRRMKEEENYSGKKRYGLLANAEDREKEVAMCGHTEKLAMAFGVLNSPEGRAIRVTKDWRVCADCHDMAKFVSKMVGREIILRDSNRFHRFEAGRCSCKGYW